MHFSEETALAQEARRRHDRDAALAHFRAASALAPEQHWILCEIGEELWQLGCIGEAEGIFEEAAQKDPRLSGAWRGLGRVLRQRGRKAEALAHFRRALALEPANIWLACDVAEELREMGQDEEAEQAYRQILDRDDQIGIAWRGLGLIARRRGDRALALRHMQQALALSPGHLWLKCECADDLRELGRLEEAAATCREVLDADPGMTQAWRGLAFIARRQGNRSGAWEHFRKALEGDPTSPWLRCDAADALRELGRLEEAEEFYREALAANENIVAGWLGRGSIARQQGRFEAAARYFRRAARLAPDEIQVQRDLIGALRDLGQSDEAERLAEALIGRWPDSPVAIMAFVDARRGRISQAEIVRLHEKSVALSPGNVWARLGLAEEYFRAERFAEAGRLYQQALAEQPDHVGALVGQARVARRLGDRIASRLLMERAVAAPEATVWTRNELAQDMAEAGEFEAAEHYLRGEIERHPGAEPHYFQLGEICNLRGDRAGARAAFAQASALNPGSESAALRTAVADFHLGRIAQAIEAVAPWIERERPTPQALETLAGFAEGTDDIESAILLRRRALALDPSRPWVYFPLAGDLAKLGRDGELAELLSECEARFGPTVDLILFRASLLKDRSDVAGAYATLTRAMELFPAHFTLRADRIAYMIGCGMFAEAEEALGRMQPSGAMEKMRLVQLRGRSAMAQWDADRAYACFTEGLKINPAESWLNEMAARAALLRADVEAALDHLRISVAASVSHRIYHRGGCKPLQSIVGQLVDEYRMDRAALEGLRASAQAEDKLAALARLVIDFPDYTPAAIGYLTELRRGGRAPALPLCEVSEERPIPRRIGQYWDADAPDDVQLLCDEWASAEPGCDYKKFSAVEAEEFIRQTGETGALAAFRRAREPTLQADLFRLFLLCHRGGFFIDADDRRLGPLQNLDPGGKDLIVCLEDWGTTGNNFIGATPHHPAIARALAQAIASINSSDNEMIWLATGPGLLTRCLAAYIAEDPASRLARTMILDLHELPRAVGAHCATSHKYSRRHWTRSAFGGRQNKSLDSIREWAEQSGDAERASAPEGA